jgi:hypothetical protein
VKVRIGVAAALLLAQVALPRPVVAANDSTATAVRLDATNTTESAQLVGNSGGAYRYYAFDYPGGGGAVPIAMRAQPGHGTTGVAAGFNVYGPGGYSAAAITSDQSTTDSGYALAVSSLTPGRYYVQVFNYVQGLPMSFQLAVDGLTPSAQPAPPPGTGSSPSQAVTTQATTLTTGGQLAGTSSGAFAYYVLDYPGGQQPMTITVGYSPITPTSDRAVGCNLYLSGLDASTGSAPVGQCAETGRNASSATTSFTLRADGAGRYLLQVTNYLSGVSIDYTLIVTGLTGPVAQVGDVSTPDRAFVLSAAQPAARGQLAGNSAGRFAYFLLPYPGGNASVRTTLTAQPNSQIGDGAFGFDLYRGSDSAGTADARLDAQGQRTATWVIEQGDAQTFGVQVFNYAKTTAVYVITVQGL